MSQDVMKVSVLVRYLKSKLDNDGYLQRVIVSGEISNFVNHRSGHWYFTIKDESSRLSCVMFASSASRSKFIPKDGDKVLVQANTSIFEASGQLQLYCTGIRLDGIGDLHVQFELLKKKLYEEGYFDESHKKSLPLYPMKLGLITGKNTAAREDVLTTLSRRWPVAELTEINTLVQGEGASTQIIDALKKMDKLDLDVILLVRGGGSIEDLWAFNDENLAKCIYQLQTPIITGVGHEIDTTIVDYVSDKRAPTPTAACEIATPDIKEVRQTLSLLRQNLVRKCQNDVEFSRNSLLNLQNSPVFKTPSILYEQKSLHLDYLANRLIGSKYSVQSKRMQFDKTTQNFHNAMSQLVMQLKYQNTTMENNLKKSVQHSLESKKENIAKQIQLLDAYSPLNILKRGYSIVKTEQGVCTSIKNIEVNDELQLQLYDGKLRAVVLEKE
ncbi:MAG: exodeoxyribonuclease VII large subunit [Anaerorhabdus sp.]